MNELQIFNSKEFGEIRTAEINGKPYFVGTDVAKALGYSNPRKAILDHCKGVTKRDTPTSSGMQSMSLASVYLLSFTRHGGACKYIIGR